ncbi:MULTISPECIES: TMEM175 family protein [Salinibaculum]|uniref:TMEM175 family protein n=1 Tax=Salinibaculum TaxID=2732368 RepID=UPI0030D39850
MALPFRRESEETDRLLALSDGVIAIAITLLVLEISVPELPPGTTSEALQAVVFDQWNQFVGYTLSFLVIGLYWTLHRRVFVYIEEHNRGVLWLNLLFLLFVAFVPYGTSVFSTYPNAFGIAFIAAVLALTGLSLALLWLYASRKRLIEEGLTSRVVTIQATRYLVSPVVFLLSIVVATVDPGWAVLTWLLLVPINAALNSRLVESIEVAAEEADSSETD